MWQNKEVKYISLMMLGLKIEFLKYVHRIHT